MDRSPLPVLLSVQSLVQDRPGLALLRDHNDRRVLERAHHMLGGQAGDKCGFEGGHLGLGFRLIRITGAAVSEWGARRCGFFYPRTA